MSGFNGWNGGNMSERAHVGKFGLRDQMLAAEEFGEKKSFHHHGISDFDAFPNPPATIPSQVYRDIIELKDVKAARCDDFTLSTTGLSLLQGQRFGLPISGLAHPTSSSSSDLSTLSSELFQGVQDILESHQGPTQNKDFSVIIETASRDSSGDPPLDDFIGQISHFTWEPGDSRPLQSVSLEDAQSDRTESRSLIGRPGRKKKERTRCPKCERSLISPEGLRRHWRNCHDNERLRAYKCRLCPKEFTAPKDLDRHLLSHSHQRGFRCKFPSKKASNQDECGKQLKRMDHARRHVTKCHGVRREDVEKYVERSLVSSTLGW